MTQKMVLVPYDRYTQIISNKDSCDKQTMNTHEETKLDPDIILAKFILMNIV